MNKVYPVILIIITFLIFCSCEKKENKVYEMETKESIEPSTDTNDPKKTIKISLSEKETENIQKKQTSNLLAVELKGTDSLLPLINNITVIPEDFQIGPLQQKYPIDENERNILSIINSFFLSLSKKIIEEKYIHPDWRSVIVHSLQYHIDKGNLPVSIRTGKIYLSGNTGARANIRLYGNPGISEGEVYLERKDGKWYISDIQIDFTILSLIYNKDYDVFEPAVFRWLNLY